MSFNIRLALLIFSIIWFIVIILSIRKDKLPVKYSLVWLFAIITVVLISIFPCILELVATIFGFETISNLVIGIILTLLMIITLVLTIVVSKQKKQIVLLIQEISIIKQNINKK